MSTKKLGFKILLLFIVLSMSILPTYASNLQMVGDTKFTGYSLKSAVQLSEDAVLKIANHQIYSYMAEDIQTKGKNIVASSDFISLFDLNNNLFAYMVPLFEVGKGEIGYITVGAIEDGCDSYQILIDDNRVDDIRSKINAMQSNKNNIQTKVVFIPPMSYALQVIDTNGIKYYDISRNDVEINDITNSVIKNSDKINLVYNNLRSINNKNKVTNILSISESSDTAMASITTADEDVRLINEETFIPIYNGSTTYYGCNQSWYSTQYKIDRGCGPAAASNITSYLARKNSSLYGNLYSPSTISKTDFATHMESVWNYVTPGYFGLSSGTEFTQDVENFASSRGVSLTTVTSSASFTLDNTSNYIKDGLNADSPVAIANLDPFYDYGWHWVTITKYFRQVSTNKRWIAVSSWGSRYSLDYNEYFGTMYAWGGSMWYFE